ncbi:TIM barrel protein [Alcaligenaceae bacterium]|nr:TIM barrel protein [Alcaligenaceae bacterium]
MKLAANLSLLYPGLSLDARAVAAARDNFKGVEVLFPYDISPQELAKLLGRHGLQLILVNTPLGVAGEKGYACLPERSADFRAGLQRALAVCQATGCAAIHVMAGAPPTDTDRSTCFNTLIDNLRYAAPIAAQARVTLTLEALNREDAPGYFYYLPEQVAEVIQAVDHPAVRMQFDFYHSLREGLDLDQALRQMLPLIHHVQFAHPQGRHEPRPNDPPVAAALRTLQQSGYDGWIGCEYIPAGDTSAGLAWRDSYHALLAMSQRQS